MNATLTTTKTTAELHLGGRDAHLNSAEDHMNNSTVAPASDNRAGLSLKQLRESHGISISHVAALAGTGVNFLMRIESGELAPTKSYMARVTFAICRLMKAPQTLCAKVGCLNVNHHDVDPDANGWHTAYEVEGDEWKVSVDWFDSQDTKWTVYGQLKDESTPLEEDKVEAFYDHWRRACVYATTLNRSGYVSEGR